MSSYKLTVTLTMKYQNQTLCLTYTLVLARKPVPVPSLSKENNKSRRTYWIKHRDRGVAGGRQPRQGPCAPFSALGHCLCCCRLGGDPGLPSHLPPLHSSAPWASCLRSSSEKVFFPQCYPCSNTLEGERGREGERVREETKEKE